MTQITACRLSDEMAPALGKPLREPRDRATTAQTLAAAPGFTLRAFQGPWALPENRTTSGHPELGQGVGGAGREHIHNLPSKQGHKTRKPST